MLLGVSFCFSYLSFEGQKFLILMQLVLSFVAGAFCVLFKKSFLFLCAEWRWPDRAGGLELSSQGVLLWVLGHTHCLHCGEGRFLCDSRPGGVGQGEATPWGSSTVEPSDQEELLCTLRPHRVYEGGHSPQWVVRPVSESGLGQDWADIHVGARAGWAVTGANSSSELGDLVL